MKLLSLLFAIALLISCDYYEGPDGEVTIEHPQVILVPEATTVLKSAKIMTSTGRSYAAIQDGIALRIDIPKLSNDEELTLTYTTNENPITSPFNLAEFHSGAGTLLYASDTIRKYSIGYEIYGRVLEQKRWEDGTDTVQYHTNGTVTSSDLSMTGRWFKGDRKAITYWDSGTEDHFVKCRGTGTERSYWGSLIFRYEQNSDSVKELREIIPFRVVPTTEITLKELTESDVQFDVDFEDWSDTIKGESYTFFWGESATFDTATATRYFIENSDSSSAIFNYYSSGLNYRRITFTLDEPAVENRSYTGQLYVHSQDSSNITVSNLMTTTMKNLTPTELPFSFGTKTDISFEVNFDTTTIEDFHSYVLCYREDNQYTRDIEDSSDFTFTIVDTTQSTSSFTVTDLPHSTSYQVALMVYDKHGEMSEFTVHTVETMHISYDNPTMTGKLHSEDSATYSWSPYIGREFHSYELRYTTNGDTVSETSRLYWESSSIEDTLVPVSGLAFTEMNVKLRLFVVRSDSVLKMSNTVQSNGHSLNLVGHVYQQQQLIALSWYPKNYSGYYMLIRREGTDGPAEVLQFSTKTSYVDSTITPGTYTYQVQMTSEKWSNEVTLTLE